MDSTPNLLTYSGLCTFTAFTCLIAAVAILANASVLYAFFSSDRLKRNLSNYFAVNLAVSDILVSIGPFSLWLLNLWHIRSRTFSPTYEGIIPASSIKMYAKSWQFLDAVLTNAAVCNLAFLSLERYFAITRPFMHRAKLSHRFMLTVCVLSWVYALVSVGPSTAFEPGESWVIAYKVVVILLPCSVMLVAYGLLVAHILLLKRNRNNAIVAAGNADGLPHPNIFLSNGREIKLTFRLSLLTLAFVLCWLPYISWILWYSTSDSVQVIERKSYFYDVSILLKYLSYLNSLLNPFLYVFGRPAFSTFLKNTFCKSRLGRSMGFRRSILASPLFVIGSDVTLKTIRERIGDSKDAETSYN